MHVFSTLAAKITVLPCMIYWNNMTDPKPPIVYVDVDDTLFRSVGNKRIPMPRVVDRVRSLSQEGAILYLWSSGGADYARRSAQELGIAELFAGFLPKPTIIIDDHHRRPTRDRMAVLRTYPSNVLLMTFDGLISPL